MKYKTLLFIFIFLHFEFISYSQQIIYVTIAGGDLYQLELDNECSSSFIGSTGLGFGDIACTPDGRLWGITGEFLYEINTSDASATLVGDIGISGVSLEALDNSTLLIEANQNLYGINTSDASNYLIGNIGYSATGDLTWYDNNLFMASGDWLIKIQLNETNTNVLNSGPINDINNAIPSCEGLATVSVTGGINSIVGFFSNNVYKICHIDGSSELICPEITIDGIPGAASIRLPIQQPEPTSCLETTVLEVYSGKQFIRTWPNPTSSNATLHLDNSLNNATAIIYNVIGEKVQEHIGINGTNVQLPFGHLSSGIYFIQIFIENQLIGSDKIIINH